MFTRQMQTEDTPQFNTACHIVKREILSEAETQKASLNSYVSQVSADVPGG